MLIRLFGVAQYGAVRRLPPRLKRAAVRIEQQRQLEENVRLARLMALAGALKLGAEYVDPNNPSGTAGPNEPYTSFKPYNRQIDEWLRQARPWAYTEEALIRRREREEEKDFSALERVMAGGAMIA